MTADDRIRLAKLWQDGLADEDIAEIMCYNTGYICTVRNSMGLAPNETRHRKLLEEKRQRALRLMESDAMITNAQVCRVCGMSETMLAKLCSDYGIDTPTVRVRKYMDNTVRELHRTMTDAQIGKLLGRTPEAIGHIRRRLGLRARFGPFGKRLKA